ncbi:MAG: type IV toxin-antitoxin system AbiEi family antitoxin [Chitinophagaceae bacterium]
MEIYFIQEALQNFKKNTGFKGAWKKTKSTATDNGMDGEVYFTFDKKKLMLPMQVSKKIGPQHLPAIFEKQKKVKDLVLVALDIPEQVAKNLRARRINYIDAAGNAFINSHDIFILIEGKKPVRPQQGFQAKAFSKTGVKIIFQFLLNPGIINETIRSIANQADVSLDTVHKTIQGLKQLGYIIPITKKDMGWNNRKELFEKWIGEYDTRLKAGLHVGSFRFVKETDFLQWKEIHLKDNTCWSGEPAGDLLTNYLRPEILTLYTKETKMEVIKNYRVLPDPNGYIRVYQKFWQGKETQNVTAPPLLVYADLINTGDKRNIETAQKIYGKFLQNKF